MGSLTPQPPPCLSDVSVWLRDLHPQLSLSKTEILNSQPIRLSQNINIQLGALSLNPTKTVQNVGVMIDDFISFSMELLSQGLVG